MPGLPNPSNKLYPPAHKAWHLFCHWLPGHPGPTETESAEDISQGRPCFLLHGEDRRQLGLGPPPCAHTGATPLWPGPSPPPQAHAEVPRSSPVSSIHRQTRCFSQTVSNCCHPGPCHHLPSPLPPSSPKSACDPAAHLHSVRHRSRVSTPQYLQTGPLPRAKVSHELLAQQSSHSLPSHCSPSRSPRALGISHFKPAASSHHLLSEACSDHVMQHSALSPEAQIPHHCVCIVNSSLLCQLPVPPTCWVLTDLLGSHYCILNAGPQEAPREGGSRGGEFPRVTPPPAPGPPHPPRRRTKGRVGLAVWEFSIPTPSKQSSLLAAAPIQGSAQLPWN